MNWLGLDIGGANLKAADGLGWAVSVSFPLWRDPGGLARALKALIDSAPATDSVAVTMTGELCDCFQTKAEGVRHIVAAAEQSAGGRPVWIYLVDGKLVASERAAKIPLLAAASNWHALARFACRFLEGHRGLAIDIGSTTTDIVPLLDSKPRPAGFDDTERLLSGELVYTGVGRTPLCAITRHLPWPGQECPVAAELFATAADAYVFLDQSPEQPAADWTADGRPLTKEFARQRLARMICADTTTFGDEDAFQAAAAVRNAQSAQVRDAVRQVLGKFGSPPEEVILSGTGEFLARHAVREVLPQAKRIVSLSEQLGPYVSEAAAAHALAVLARDGGIC